MLRIAGQQKHQQNQQNQNKIKILNLKNRTISTALAYINDKLRLAKISTFESHHDVLARSASSALT